jgi:tRNA(Ile)-lysidine synthase
MNAESVRRYCAQYALLPAGTAVLCAVSGGADSVALLHVLCAMPELTVRCAHFNHRLRGAESDRDERFVRDLCETLGVPCVTGSGAVAARSAAEGRGVEAAARALRYAFLERTAAEQGCGRIATAHTADDNAETMLLHLVHGTGLRGLCGIPPMRGAIVRPLLNVPRSEILDYLAAHGLPHVEDSSNESDDYARNRLRHRAMPALADLNPAAVRNFSAAAETLREDEAFLERLAAAFLQEHRADDTLPAAALAALPKPVAMRALRVLCGESGRAHLEAVLALAGGDRPHGAADIPGMRVVKERDILRFGPRGEAPAPLPRRALRPGETLTLPEIGMRVSCRELRCPGEIHNSFNTFYFHREKICGRISVASRAEGDSVRLAGRGCTKTLKKLFSEAGLLLRERALVPVVYDEAGVAAVCGFGAAERLTPAPGEPALQLVFSKIALTEAEEY